MLAFPGLCGGRRIFSNVWKTASVFFQCLEKVPLNFPMVGKPVPDFSNVWKTAAGHAVAGAMLLAGAAGVQAVAPTPPLAPELAAQIRLVLEQDRGLAPGKLSAAPWNFTGQNNEDAFGYVVTGAGDVNGDGCGDVIAGAYGYGGYRGKAYVFLGATNGLKGTPPSPAWSAQGEALDNYFGYAAAAAGDVNGDGYGDVLIGAYGYATNHGKIYLFYGSATGVTGTAATPAWSVRGENPWDRLGQSLAGAGDVNGDGYADLLAGAYLYTNGSGWGRAYVFHGSAAGPAASSAGAANWKVSGEHAADVFGHALAGAGDFDGDGFDDILVGAYKFDGNRGRIYLFRGSAGGVTPGSAAACPFKLGGGTAQDFYGYSVAGAGDVNGDGYADFLVGAPQWDAGGNRGAVYVTYGYAMAKGAKRFAESVITGENANDRFGYRVGPAGDYNGDGYADILATAFGFPAGAENGKVYFFPGTSNGVTATTAAGAFWSRTGSAAGDRLGLGLGAAGDIDGDGLGDVMMGTPGFSNGANRGQATLNYGWSALPTHAAATMTGQNTSDFLGYPAVAAGDVNGDGYGDLLVSASRYDNLRGKVYVFHGGATGLAGAPGTPAWTTTGENAGDAFGSAAAAAGDVNGDGYDDIVVGAENYNAGGATYAGKVYVFHGGPVGITNHGAGHAGWSMVGESTNSQFGQEVAGAGDVNGDGFADILVAGQVLFNARRQGTVAYRGKVYAFHGSAAGVYGTAAAAAWHALGENAADLFGDSLAAAGDVNGDGYGDIIVGARNFQAPTRGRTLPKYRGKAYVFQGSSAGLQGLAIQPAWSAVGEAEADTFGRAVAGAGDVNGDGYDDVIVGAPGYPSNNVGRAYVFYGGAAGVSTGAVWQFTGTAAGDSFGLTVAAAGDINSDGYAEVLVGAPGYPAGGWQGCMYLFRGSPFFHMASYVLWTVTGQNNMDSFAMGVAGAGDLNADGFADVVTAAPSYSNAMGKLYVYYGSEGGGRGVRLRALQSGNDQLLPPWGRSGGGNVFRARINGYAPWGRARVKLQVQAVPAGRMPGAAGTLQFTSPEWVATPTSAGGAEISLMCGALQPQALYRWRARVLYAPLTARNAPFPAHGPWRTFRAQAGNAGTRSGSAFPPWWLLLQ